MYVSFRFCLVQCIKKDIKKMIRKICLVIACLLLHMLTAGMSLSFGVLYREMRVEFGTSQSEAAWIASIFNGLTGLVGIPLSFITIKIGEKWPAVCGSILLALGMLSSMFANKTSTVYVTYGLIAGLGAGTSHYCGYTVMAPHFTDRWRPVAMTVASAGIPLSALILPPVMTLLIEQFDWRKAFMVLACLSLLGVPAGLCFFPPKLHTDTQPESTAGREINGKLSLSRFLKNPNYMLYFVSTFVVFLIIYLPATFLPDLMHEFGRSSREVYICVMTMGACDLFGRLLSGYLVHKMPSYLALIHSAGLMVLCVSSGLITLSRSIGTFVVMSSFVGLGTGCFAGLHFVLATHLLPMEDVRFGYGLVLTFGGLALVAGMPLAGFVTDFFKTEKGGFIFSCVMFFIGSSLEFLLGIREICRKKSEMTYAIKAEENTAYVADIEVRVNSVKSGVVGIDDSSYILQCKL